jgi:hypothetical protein
LLIIISKEGSEIRRSEHMLRGLNQARAVSLVAPCALAITQNHRVSAAVEGTIGVIRLCRSSTVRLCAVPRNLACRQATNEAPWALHNDYDFEKML